MVDRSHRQAQLKELLDEEIEGGRHLLAALDAERHALGSGDSASLDQTGTHKQAAFERLLQLERARSDLCQALGYEGDSEGMEELIASCDAGSSLTKKWKQLLEVMLACRQTNEVNGKVVKTKLQQVQKGLDLIRGNATQDKLYGPSGETAIEYNAVPITTA